MNRYILPVVGQSLFQNTALSAGEGNGNSSAEVTAGGTVRSGRDLAGEELLCVCRKLLT